MPEDRSIPKRNVAYKVMIKDIIKGNYIKVDGWNPNYLVLENGKQISRINIIGTIIDKPFSNKLEYQSTVIDDSSGNINLRTFNNKDVLNDFGVGDSILVIGRPREFGNEKYILPEIIKKIDDKDWVELRKLELEKNNTLQNPKEDPNKIDIYDLKEEIITEDNNIFALIKKLDNGEGADLNEVVEKSNNQYCEKIINNMIKQGGLFEIKPGKIKILE